MSQRAGKLLLFSPFPGAEGRIINILWVSSQQQFLAKGRLNVPAIMISSEVGSLGIEISRTLASELGYDL